MTQQGDYSVGTRGNREPNKGTTGFCVRGTKRGETYRTVSPMLHCIRRPDGRELGSSLMSSRSDWDWAIITEHYL
jgi:hypothetical protein